MFKAIQDLEDSLMDLSPPVRNKAVLEFLPTSVTYDGDPAIFVFDRCDESSLYTAAILKSVIGCPVTEIESISKMDLQINHRLIWLGIIPPTEITKAIPVRHHCLINTFPDVGETIVETTLGEELFRRMRSKVKTWVVVKTKRPGWNVEILEGSRTSILSHLYEEMLIDAIGILPQTHVKLKKACYVSTLVERFGKPSTPTEVVMGVWPVIESAYKYLYEGKIGHDLLETEVERFITPMNYNQGSKTWVAYFVDSDYCKAVRATREQLRLFGRAKHGELNLVVGDEHFYIAKRIITTSGQVWSSTRVLTGGIFNAGNRNAVKIPHRLVVGQNHDADAVIA